jgi:chromosome transmission fidelity protein 1
MKILYTELRTHFKVKLVNEHFIEDTRIFANIVDKDLQGNEFKFNFDNKDMRKSYREVGYLLYKLEKSIKGGILIFFTSYTHLHDCYASWLESGLNFGNTKIFHEEKDNDSSVKNYDQYISYVKENNCGIFLCVCRGKLSEGLNF